MQTSLKIKIKNVIKPYAVMMISLIMKFPALKKIVSGIFDLTPNLKQRLKTMYRINKPVNNIIVTDCSMLSPFAKSIYKELTQK